MSVYQPVHGEKNDPYPAISATPTTTTEPEPDEQSATQLPLDVVDEASMESFPCSDPPSYTRSHA